MNVSYQWLKEYLNLDEITPDALADKMSRTGIEVEDVFYGETGLKKLLSVILYLLLIIQTQITCIFVKWILEKGNPHKLSVAHQILRQVKK